MKSLVIILLALSVASCGKIERSVAGFTGGGVETCHDGVKYVQFTSGASVKYNRDGTIATC